MRICKLEIVLSTCCVYVAALPSTIPALALIFASTITPEAIAVLFIALVTEPASDPVKVFELSLQFPVKFPFILLANVVGLPICSVLTLFPILIA